MTRLLVLWLLMEHPMHGYQIKKSLTDDDMGFWFGLDDAAIYSVLRTLDKGGYVKMLGEEQVGNRPQRTRYAITKTGRSHYRDLLKKAWTTIDLPMLPIDVALAARGDLSPTEIAECIAQRQKNTYELRSNARQSARALPTTTISDRVDAHLQAELDWLAQLDPASVS